MQPQVQFLLDRRHVAAPRHEDVAERHRDGGAVAGPHGEHAVLGDLQVIEARILS